MGEEINWTLEIPVFTLAAIGLIINLLSLLYRVVRSFTLPKLWKYSLVSIDAAHIFLGSGLVLQLVYKILDNEKVCESISFLLPFGLFDCVSGYFIASIIVLCIYNPGKASHLSSYHRNVFLVIFIPQKVISIVLSLIPILPVSIFDRTTINSITCFKLPQPSEKGFLYGLLEICVSWLCAVVALIFCIISVVKLSKGISNRIHSASPNVWQAQLISHGRQYQRILIIEIVIWICTLLVVTVINYSSKSLSSAVLIVLGVTTIIHGIITNIGNSMWSLCCCTSSQTVEETHRKLKQLELVRLEAPGKLRLRATWNIGKSHTRQGLMKVYGPKHVKAWAQEIVVLGMLRKIQHASLLQCLWTSSSNPYYETMTLITGEIVTSDSRIICLELTNSGTLQDMIKRLEAPLPEACQRMIIHDVAEGLYYLHDQNILHNNLNSSSIYLKGSLPSMVMRAAIGDFEDTLIFGAMQQSTGHSIRDKRNFFLPDIRSFALIALEIISNMCEKKFATYQYEWDQYLLEENLRKSHYDGPYYNDSDFEDEFYHQKPVGFRSPGEVIEDYKRSRSMSPGSRPLSAQSCRSQRSRTLSPDMTRSNYSPAVTLFGSREATPEPKRSRSKSPFAKRSRSKSPFSKKHKKKNRAPDPYDSQHIDSPMSGGRETPKQPSTPSKQKNGEAFVSSDVQKSKGKTKLKKVDSKKWMISKFRTMTGSETAVSAFKPKNKVEYYDSNEEVSDEEILTVRQRISKKKQSDSNRSLQFEKENPLHRTLSNQSYQSLQQAQQELFRMNASQKDPRRLPDQSLHHAMLAQQDYMQRTMSNNSEQMQRTMSSNSEQMQRTMSNNSEQMQRTISYNSEQMYRTMSNNSEQMQRTMSNNSEQMQRTISYNSEQMQRTMSNNSEQMYRTMSNNSEQMQRTMSNNSEQMYRTMSNNSEQMHRTMSNNSEHMMSSSSGRPVHRTVSNQSDQWSILSDMEYPRSHGLRNTISQDSRASLWSNLPLPVEMIEENRDNLDEIIDCLPGMTESVSAQRNKSLHSREHLVTRDKVIRPKDYWRSDGPGPQRFELVDYYDELQGKFVRRMAPHPFYRTASGSNVLMKPAHRTYSGTQVLHRTNSGLQEIIEATEVSENEDNENFKHDLDLAHKELRNLGHNIQQEADRTTKPVQKIKPIFIKDETEKSDDKPNDALHMSKPKQSKKKRSKSVDKTVTICDEYSDSKLVPNESQKKKSQARNALQKKLGSKNGNMPVIPLSDKREKANLQVKYANVKKLKTQSNENLDLTPDKTGINSEDKKGNDFKTYETFKSGVTRYSSFSSNDSASSIGSSVRVRKADVSLTSGELTSLSSQADVDTDGHTTDLDLPFKENQMRKKLLLQKSKARISDSGFDSESSDFSFDRTHNGPKISYIHPEKSPTAVHVEELPYVSIDTARSNLSETAFVLTGFENKAMVYDPDDHHFVDSKLDEIDEQVLPENDIIPPYLESETRPVSSLSRIIEVSSASPDAIKDFNNVDPFNQKPNIASVSEGKPKTSRSKTMSKELRGPNVYASPEAATRRYKELTKKGVPLRVSAVSSDMPKHSDVKQPEVIMNETEDSGNVSDDQKLFDDLESNGFFKSTVNSNTLSPPHRQNRKSRKDQPKRRKMKKIQLDDIIREIPEESRSPSSNNRSPAHQKSLLDESFHNQSAEEAMLNQPHTSEESETASVHNSAANSTLSSGFTKQHQPSVVVDAELYIDRVYSNKPVDKRQFQLMDPDFDSPLNYQQVYQPLNEGQCINNEYDTNVDLDIDIPLLEGMNEKHVINLRKMTTQLNLVSFHDLLPASYDNFMMLKTKLQQGGQLGNIGTQLLDIIHNCWLNELPPTSFDLVLQLTDPVTETEL